MGDGGDFEHLFHHLLHQGVEMRRWILLLLLLFAALLLAGVAGGSTIKINSSDIMLNISKGAPVDYVNVIIVGDLDLTGLNLTSTSIERTLIEVQYGLSDAAKLVNSPISIKNSYIAGDVIFRDAVFNEPVEFDGTEFSSRADFRGSIFQKSATFNGAYFDREANFLRAEFIGESAFIGSAFKNIANFWRAEFGEGFELHGDFRDATFEGDVTFIGARFDGFAVFDDAQFKKNAYFGEAQFNGFITFFEGAGFNGITELNSAKFEGDAYFDGATFGEESTLNLNRTKFGRFYVDWRSIKDPLVYDGAVYLALVKNYKDLERYDEANDCYYAFRAKSPVKGPLDYLEWIFYGFGVKPIYPFAWSVFIISFFGVLFWRGNGIKKYVRREILDEGSTDQGIELTYRTAQKEERMTLKDPFLFSLITFTSQLASFIYPSVDFKTDGLYKRLAILEQSIGSLLIALLIATITKTYLVS